jgi:hypothetical protein
VPNPRTDAVKPTDIREIKIQLDRLTAKLKQYEFEALHCPHTRCIYVFDGLRLSQEVEILRRQNIALTEEIGFLKRQLSCAATGA